MIRIREAIIIVWVLGKVGGGFLIPGNLRVFLFDSIFLISCRDF